MERTLVILKPSALIRRLVGKITHRFEQKGLRLIGMKLMNLDDNVLNIHYAHLEDKPFFNDIKESMKRSPVVVQCWEGVDVANVVRLMIGVTNGREAQPGTIRGDFAVSTQENIIHASDSKESATIELKRFFTDNELFKLNDEISATSLLYANSEL